MTAQRTPRPTTADEGPSPTPFPPSPFQREHERLDPELRGIRSRGRPHGGREPRVQEIIRVEVVQVAPEVSAELRQTVGNVRKRLAQMEARGKLYLWSETDIARVRQVLDYVSPPRRPPM